MSLKNKDKKTYLYRHYNSDNELLYVGISCDYKTRNIAHRQSSWWSKISYIKLDDFHDRKSAHAAETYAIKTENPKYNLRRISNKTNNIDCRKIFANIPATLHVSLKVYAAKNDMLMQDALINAIAEFLDKA